MRITYARGRENYNYIEFKKGVEYSLIRWVFYKRDCNKCNQKTGIVFNEQGALEVCKSKALRCLCPKCFLKTKIITKEELKFLLTYVSLL